MKKTCLKSLISIGVSAATIMAAGCICLADEMEVQQEDVPVFEETEETEEPEPEDIYIEEYTEITEETEPSEEPEDLEIEDLETLEVSASSGWVQDSEGYWRYYVNGVMTTGWKDIGKYRYYFDPDNGIMCTYHCFINNHGYFFDENGHMLTGLVCSGSTFYFNEDGSQFTGWKNVDGNWYLFGWFGCSVGREQNVDKEYLGGYAYYFFDYGNGNDNVNPYPNSKL